MSIKPYSKNISVKVNNDFKSSEGIFNITNYEILGNPNSYGNFTLSTDAVDL